MEINIDKLMTISNYAILKKLSRQHVHRLVQCGDINCIIIDGVKFVLLDEKALQFERKRV